MEGSVWFGRQEALTCSDTVTERKRCEVSRPGLSLLSALRLGERKIRNLLSTWCNFLLPTGGVGGGGMVPQGHEVLAGWGGALGDPG